MGKTILKYLTISIFLFCGSIWAQDFTIKGIVFVKHKPSQDGLILAVIKKEATVRLLTEKEGWAKIQLSGGVVGWVPGDKLIKSENLSASTPTIPPKIEMPFNEADSASDETKTNPDNFSFIQPDTQETSVQAAPSNLLTLKKTNQSENKDRFSYWPYLPSLILLVLLVLIWRNSKTTSEKRVRSLVNQEIKRQSEVFKTHVDEKQAYLIHQISTIEQNIASVTDRVTARQERIENRFRKLVSQELPTVFHNLKSTLNKILVQQNQQIEKLNQEIQAQEQGASQTLAEAAAATGQVDRLAEKLIRLEKSKHSDGRKMKPGPEEVVIVKTDS